MAIGTLERANVHGETGVDEPLYEIVNGEKVEIPHMGALAGTIATFLVIRLGSFGEASKLGFPVTEVMFDFGSDRRQRRPDVAFIRWDRWEKLPSVKEDPPAWQVVPNVATEVVSPTNTAADIESRLLEYFEAGVELVWVIYPIQQRVYVHESPAETRVLGISDDLDGGQVLPGFRLKVAELFAVLQPK